MMGSSRVVPHNDDEKYDKIREQEKKFRTTLAILLTTVVLGALFGLSLRESSAGSNITSETGMQLASAARKVVPDEKEVSKDTHRLMVNSELAAEVARLDEKVREVKSRVEFMETDPEGIRAAKALQEATRQLLHVRYGEAEPYRVRVVLRFQNSIPDYEKNGPNGSFMIELAPSSLQPHSIFTFLEIARQWEGGAFHRQAHHVLQVMVKGHHVEHLAFQEYSEEFPHKKGTVGYAGRPSGPAFYVSILDNTHNHGPGSQQKRNPYEADSCFGKVVEGFDDVIPRISKMPAKEGFISDKKKHVLIEKMEILVPNPKAGPGEDAYVMWEEPDEE